MRFRYLVSGGVSLWVLAGASRYGAIWKRWTLDRCGNLVGYLVTFKPGEATESI